MQLYSCTRASTTSDASTHHVSTIVRASPASESSLDFQFGASTSIENPEDLTSSCKTAGIGGVCHTFMTNPDRTKCWCIESAESKIVDHVADSACPATASCYAVYRTDPSSSTHTSSTLPASTTS